MSLMPMPMPMPMLARRYDRLHSFVTLSKSSDIATLIRLTCFMFV